MSKQLQRLADNDERFDMYSNETNAKGDQGDGHWLYTAKGWWHPHTETHCIHEWTVKAVLAEVRFIERCNCSD